MNRKIVIILVIALVVIVGIKIVNNNKEDVNNTGTSTNIAVSENPIEIEKLSDIFPSKNIKYDFEYEGVKTKVSVTNIEETDEGLIVKTQREEKQDDGNVTVEMTYKITDEKIVESGEYIKDGKTVSTIYASEIVKGDLTVGNSWTSVDGLITTKVVASTKSTVTIESSREYDEYAENSKVATKKTYVEIRKFEKGKGIVSYKTEIR